LLELFLECCELGERRVGIGLPIRTAAARTVGLGIILLTLGALGTVLAPPARPVAAGIAALPLAATLVAIAALPLTLLALLAFVTVAACPTVGTVLARMMRRPLLLRRFAAFDRLLRRARSYSLASFGRFVGARTARTMWTPLGTARRAPDFNHGWLLRYRRRTGVFGRPGIDGRRSGLFGRSFGSLRNVCGRRLGSRFRLDCDSFGGDRFTGFRHDFGV
jgi:hypothetical protein